MLEIHSTVSISNVVRAILLLLFIASSSASPVPGTERSSLAAIEPIDTSGHAVTSLTAFDRSKLQHESPTTLTRALALNKRALPSHRHRYKSYGAIVPTMIVTPQLKTSYDTIVSHANSILLSVPEKALFTITEGPFQFTVSCLGSEIPWSAVAGIAQKLSGLANRGLVESFDAYFTYPDTSITLAVSLRLVSDLIQMRSQTQQPTRRKLQPRSSWSDAVSIIEQRAPGNPQLKMTKFKALTFTIPPTLEAFSREMMRFEDFYNIIATKIVTGAFASRPPSKNIILELWNFELHFTCDKMNIPWSFVQAFVIDMADWSSREFSGLYEAVIRGEGALSGLVFLVRMKLKDPPLGRGPGQA